MSFIKSSDFGMAMDKWKLLAKRGLVDEKFGTLAYAGQKLLERIMELTPAHGSDPATAQYVAIRNDVYKLVQVMPPIVMSAIEARSDLASKRLDGWLHDAKRGVHLRMNAAGYIRTPEELRAIHKRQYTQRGRVRGFPPGARYYISPFVLGRYLEKTMNPMAGKAKAGWLPAALALFKGKMVGKKIPNYALRHLPGKGVFINGLQAPRPFIEARNRTRWARNDIEADRIVRNAIASRTRNMETFFRRTMEGAAKKAGMAA